MAATESRRPWPRKTRRGTIIVPYPIPRETLRYSVIHAIMASWRGSKPHTTLNYI